MILVVDRHANGHTEQPMIRQRLRPQRVDFERRGLHGAPFLRDSLFLEGVLSDPEAAQQNEKSSTKREIGFPLQEPHCFLLKAEDLALDTRVMTVEVRPV